MVKRKTHSRGITCKPCIQFILFYYSLSVSGSFSMGRTLILMLGLITGLIDFHNGAETPETFDKSQIGYKKSENDNTDLKENETNQDKLTKMLETKYSIITRSANLQNTG